MTTTFKPHQRVRLRPDVARRLQKAHGKFNPLFQKLVGVVGELVELPWSEYKYGKADWRWVVNKRVKFNVQNHELEAIEEETK